MKQIDRMGIDSMADVLKAMGENMLEVDLPFAIFTFFRVWATCILAMYLTSISPWYLLPFAWILQGTAMTGLFVVGHDCAHQSFSHSRILNEIFGTMCMSPLLFPYKGWEQTHNHHHKHANNMDKDFLWKPLEKSQTDKMPEWKKTFLYYFYGPFFFQSSMVHHAYHYMLPIFSRTLEMKLASLRSCLFCIVTGYFLFPYIASLGNFWSLYFIPFCVFQFWLSTFTYFHHRHKDAAGWRKTENWDNVFGGLFATIHVDFPAWVEFLTLDINWHLPHHASSLVPWYNLRPATFNLLKAYGKMLKTDVFSWSLWRDTTTQCHMYSDKGFEPLYTYL